MNFLAHLHLASLAKSSLLGNLMADFVRGNPTSYYNESVVQGIRLHRKIDVTTDSHPLVKEARQYFRPEYRRVAPITLDIIWDHFLSLHWENIEPNVSLSQFIHKARATIEPQLAFTPEKFQELNEFLWSQNWLIRYAECDFIEEVLKGMARRRPRLAALADTYQDFIAHYSQFELIFERLYPQMMDFAINNHIK